MIRVDEDQYYSILFIYCNISSINRLSIDVTCRHNFNVYECISNDLVSAHAIVRPRTFTVTTRLLKGEQFIHMLRCCWGHT